MKNLKLLLGLLLFSVQIFAQTPAMYYGDTSRVGRPYSKDLHVVKFKGQYSSESGHPPQIAK